MNDLQLKLIDDIQENQEIKEVVDNVLNEYLKDPTHNRLVLAINSILLCAAARPAMMKNLTENKILYLHLFYMRMRKSLCLIENDRLTPFLSYFIEQKRLYDSLVIINKFGGIPKTNFALDFYDIKKRYEFLNLCLLNWDKYNTEEAQSSKGKRAIYIYYLGGAVSAFDLFDNEIDSEENNLTPQEYYYYCLTSKIVDMDFKSISDDALKRINETDVNSFYYKGQIHMLRDDRVQAQECFEQIRDHSPWASVMINYLQSGKEELRTPSKHKIDFDSFDFSIFDEYYHFHECLLNFRGYNTVPLIYKYFTGSVNDIEERIKEVESEFLSDIMYRDLKDRTIQLSQEEYDKRLKILDEYLGSVRPDARRSFFETNLGIEKYPEKAEIQIGLTIEQFDITNIDFYALLIYNYYFRGIIDQEAVIYLSCYVVAIAKLKLAQDVAEKVLYAGVSAMVTMTVIKLLCPFDYVNPFRQICMSSPLIMILQNAIVHDTSLPMQSHYELFKKRLKIEIAELKKQMGESTFKIQCRFTTIMDKILQIDEYFKNIK